MLTEIKHKDFNNGTVYALETHDGYPIEVTDTFLPYYTKDAINNHTNQLQNSNFGDRSQRWMIGVSVMSGCPIHCKFCATGSLPKWRSLTTEEIVAQVRFILDRHPELSPNNSKEFKINYTRMGEPFYDRATVVAVYNAMEAIDDQYPNTHHYISTIGIKGSDPWFMGLKPNDTLQISLHALSDDRRGELIPHKDLMTIEELGKIRTRSGNKTTLNLTLVDKEDFDIDVLTRYFDPEYFFIKLSPINPNPISKLNNLGYGAVHCRTGG